MVSPEPEPPFSSRCPVQPWHGQWDSSVLARRHNQSRVEPVTEHKWFSATVRDRNLPCAPISERRRTASYFNIRLGSPMGAPHLGPQTHRGILTGNRWKNEFSEPRGRRPCTDYTRKFGGTHSPEPSPPKHQMRQMQQMIPQPPQTHRPGWTRDRPLSPGKQRLHSPDPIIVNDVHEPSGKYFSREHQHWPDPIPPIQPGLRDAAREKEVTGVPNSYFNPHHVSYWESPNPPTTVKLQKRPAWYNNIYGQNKCLVLRR